jgi:hypothetical protein
VRFLLAYLCVRSVCLLVDLTGDFVEERRFVHWVGGSYIPWVLFEIGGWWFVLGIVDGWSR